MRKFDIPEIYKSSIIGRIKEAQKETDPRKKNFAPTLIDFGPVKFYLARHFGFCYGVENAIEISYRALEENPTKKVYLLSQMIHNPEVNNDLQEKGIQFIMDTDGTLFMDWDQITKEDVVIIPAFGTTVETENLLKQKGVQIEKYNTTCPFVEKVWNRSSKLGSEDYTILIHGKSYHEETRATFSHSIQSGKSVIIKDIEEAAILAEIILDKRPTSDFFPLFAEKHSEGFNPLTDLERIGVVNQTTMLASETQKIADLIRNTMLKKFGKDDLSLHFADTRDTLCYATNDNQDATQQLLDTSSDLAIVVGGYNSSNTSHLVEILEGRFATFFIKSEKEIMSREKIRHFDIHNGIEKESPFINSEQITIAITSGASCPDTLLDSVILSIIDKFENTLSLEEVLRTTTTS